MEEIELLGKFVQLGKMKAIHHHIATLHAVDSLYKPFYNKLDQLALQYDGDALLAFLQSVTPSLLFLPKEGGL